VSEIGVLQPNHVRCICQNEPNQRESYHRVLHLMPGKSARSDQTYVPAQTGRGNTLAGRLALLRNGINPQGEGLKAAAHQLAATRSGNQWHEPLVAIRFAHGRRCERNRPESHSPSSWEPRRIRSRLDQYFCASTKERTFCYRKRLTSLEEYPGGSPARQIWIQSSRRPSSPIVCQMWTSDGRGSSP